MLRAGGLGLLASGLLVGLAPADTLIHKDGRMFDGVRLKVVEDHVEVMFEHGTVEVPTADVLDLVFDDEKAWVPKTDEERERFADGQVRYQGEWMSRASRDKIVARALDERRAEIEERKASRLWRNREIVETKNFVFESTAPKHVTAYYRDLCEAYFQEFAKTWKIRRGKVGKLTVKFFVDQDNFQQVTGAGPYTLGFFRFLEPFELCIYYDRLDPQQTEEVLFHELGHYLQKLIEVEFAYPHWPGEALSEYYGASTWDPNKKKVEVGKVLAGRVQEVRFDIDSGNPLSLVELLTHAHERTYHDYNWGWTLVHFLMSDKRYAKNFNKFYVALAKARDVDRAIRDFGRTILKTVEGDAMLEAFQEYMKIKSPEDLAELEQAWYAHIDENLGITDVRGVENAAMKNMGQGRDLRARRLFEEAISMGTENAVTYYRYAILLRAMNEPVLARQNWELAIEHDPLVAEFYIALGRFLVDRGTKHEYDEGERLLRLAFDIEPDNYYLDLNLERILRDGKRRIDRASD